MNNLLLLIVVGLLLLQEQKTIKLPDPGGEDNVTYPAASFSEEEIKNIVRLSPKLRMSVSYPVMTPIEMCIEGDAEYHGCGTDAAQGKWFENNARVNIKRMEIALDTLNKLSNVDGLKEIVQYEQPLQAFYLEVEKIRLQFHLSGDLSLLEKPILGIDPRTHCTHSLTELSNTKSRKAADEIVRMDWYNCLNAQVRIKVGPYPTDAWSAFLQTAGINESYAPVEEYWLCTRK
jgi:hypothetical protein